MVRCPRGVRCSKAVSVHYTIHFASRVLRLCIFILVLVELARATRIATREFCVKFAVESFVLGEIHFYRLIFKGTKIHFSSRSLPTRLARSSLDVCAEELRVVGQKKTRRGGV